MGGHLEDIANVCKQGCDVDDDNEPALENIPSGQEVTSSAAGFKEGQSWGWGGIGCHSIIKPEKEGHL